MPDRKAIIPGKCLRIRVAGIVFCQEKLLVVEHGNSARHWACYPGGGLEPGEELPACLKRELNEELGIDCAIQHLSAVGDFIDGGVHSIEFFFRCEAPSLRINASNELYSAQFVPIAELPAWTVYPVEITHDINRIFSRIPDERPVFYGRFK
jgi:8-oxo-dGTP diphosphatase